ncbi:unnamed protein product [Linum trigynum]|uniref:Uncharacterized protein n=1 Tax=Linum trigynum TaxID=586398 RepID=A0AAV2CXX4_9ROSI
MVPTGVDVGSEIRENPSHAGNSFSKLGSEPSFLSTPPGPDMMEARGNWKATGFEGEPMFGDPRRGGTGPLDLTRAREEKELNFVGKDGTWVDPGPLGADRGSISNPSQARWVGPKLAKLDLV